MIRNRLSSWIRGLQLATLRLRIRSRTVDVDRSLDALATWLARAQDVTDDDGLAQAYFPGEGRWTASYPETTGYAIPTLLLYARVRNDDEYRRRALRMADWEVGIQLPDGGVQASTVDAPQKVPTVFNTGMVILGWLPAYRETGNGTYLEAAIRAGRWLLSQQDPDGAWRKGGSTVTQYSLNTYNTRVAWSLLDLGQESGQAEFTDAGVRNLEWALTQQAENGWFQNNCLLDNARPYTHTIAYVTRGFLESYVHTNDERHLAAATRAFEGLRPQIRPDGYLPGRLDSRWRPAANYCCLTGNSQLAVIALRLYHITGRAEYVEDARKLLWFVLRTQDLETEELDIRGGIAGSFPISGKYHPGQYPNWAAKFTLDAALLWTLKDEKHAE